MKKYLILIIIVLLQSCLQKQLYCDKVVDKYLLHKNNGGTHNIIFYSEELKRNVNVSVTEDTYVNSEIGKNVCFELNSIHK